MMPAGSYPHTNLENFEFGPWRSIRQFTHLFWGPRNMDIPQAVTTVRQRLGPRSFILQSIQNKIKKLNENK